MEGKFVVEYVYVITASVAGSARCDDDYNYVHSVYANQIAAEQFCFENNDAEDLYSTQYTWDKIKVQ